MKWGRKRDVYFYDEKGKALFSTDPSENEIYISDKSGNQIYPRQGQPFAKNSNNRQYYATDCLGNEYYPIRENKSIFIYSEGRPVLAKYVTGKERYPTDKYGNQYYIVHPVTKVPILFKDENGVEYFAVSKNGYPLIPWNLMVKYKHDLYQYNVMLDVAGNIVFCSRKSVTFSKCRCMGFTFQCLRCCIIPMSTYSTLLGVLMNQYNNYPPVEIIHEAL